jgi:transposase
MAISFSLAFVPRSSGDLGDYGNQRKVSCLVSTQERNVQIDMIPSSRTLKYKKPTWGYFMSRKSKIDVLEKVKLVEQYLNGEISQKGAAKVCDVNKWCVQDWIRIYKIEGLQRLLTLKTNKRYPNNLKQKAVQAYLSGEGSLDEICATFGIRHHVQLMSWIKVYNEGKELKELTEGSTIKKARKTTLEERIAIVKD